MKKIICIKLILLTFLGYAITAGADSRLNSHTDYPKTTYDGVAQLFEMYPCPIQCTTLTGDLDKKSFAEWKNFKTRIIEGSKRKVNFGGQFIIVEWGCGTECQMGAMIDASTGKIYEIPSSAYGKAYKKGSLLFIVNPPSKNPSENVRPHYGYPAYYFWDGDEFKLLHDTKEK